MATKRPAFRDDPAWKAKESLRKKAWYQANKERCKKDVLARYRKERAGNSPALMVRRKRQNCPPGVRFDLRPEDITIPARCPALGIPLRMATGRVQPNSPTLDRIDPKRGYVRGNVAVISHRANAIKNNASIEDLEKILRWLRSLRNG